MSNDLNQVTASRLRVSDPALGETCLTSLSALNRRVRTRMLGDVGTGEGNLPGYPIRLGMAAGLRAALLFPYGSARFHPYAQLTTTSTQSPWAVASAASFEIVVGSAPTLGH